MTEQRRRRERRAHLPGWYRWALVAFLVIVAVVMAPWLYFRVATAGDIHGPNSAPEHAYAALVLGAKVGADGEPSNYLRERVAVASQLYADGVVDVLIMSGDGSSRPGYDEPAVMRELALAAGVPDSAILLDPYGLDTYASCYNAVHTFAVESVVVVTQEFHAYRATWTCGALGLNAQAAHAPIGGSRGTITGNVREVLADWNALLEVWGGRAG